MEPPNIEKMVVLARQRWGTYCFKSCSHIVVSTLWPVNDWMRAMIFIRLSRLPNLDKATAHIHPVEIIGLAGFASKSEIFHS